MKKILFIIFLQFFCINHLYANDNFLDEFNEWLTKNGHYDYLNDPNAIVPKVCKEEKRFSNLWYYNKCDEIKSGNNLDINFFKSSEIPWGTKPNKDTLLYYLFRYLEIENEFDRAGSKGSKNPYKFEISLRADDDKTLKKVRKAMTKTSMLSYLLYEDGKITIDEISPKDRFGIMYKDFTQYTSASVGKSLVSYVTGHAICKGYINGIDHRLNDWPLLENTLFYDQKLINLLNMATGHQKYADFNLKTDKYHKNANSNTVEFHLKKGVFKNSKKAKSKYQYTNFLSNLLINYVWFKSEGKFQDLLDEIFVDKAKIEHDAWFLKMNDRTIKMNNRNNTILKEYEVKDEDGPLRYSFRASRYDYLRIAKAMLDDWQNDTCVGKYLKTIRELRIPKNDKWKDDNTHDLNSKSYAGKFHTNYAGMAKRNVMGMSGYGGQSIMIDFDRGRINVINSIHTDYNWRKIAHSVIKKGK
ncbi:hypothetical protein N9L88_02750 [Candidatus Pelagibacter bacterium]|jgi:hypothetical protein|nr:hypothetical protein [Candidatus Pelagibacter bacterium]